MRILVRFFAGIREQLGCSVEEVQLPETVRNIGQLRMFLIGRGGVWSDALSFDKPVRVACQFEMASDDTELEEGVEVAFFPPVTGG